MASEIVVGELTRCVVGIKKTSHSIGVLAGIRGAYKMIQYAETLREQVAELDKLVATLEADST